MDAKTLEQSKIDLADIMGESPDKISLIRTDWNNFMKQGVIIKLHIRRWRAKARLDLDDLGLHDTSPSEADELIQLGEKYLMPQRIIRELDSIETSARANIEKYSFETYWGRFIPAKAYQSWKAENEIWKARYFALRDRIEEEYYSNQTELLTAYRKTAALAYQRMKALTPDKMSNYELLDQEYFINRFIDKISRLIPNRYEIYKSFGYEEELNYIPLPYMIEEEQIALELARSEAQTILAADKAKRAGIEQAIETKSVMEMDILKATMDKKAELIDGFLTDIQSQIRSLINEATMGVLASIKRNGNLQPRSIVQLQTLINNIGYLNFWGDKDADRIIAKLEFILQQKAEARRDGIDSIEKTLIDIATITRGTLQAIGETPRSPKGTTLQALGLIDQPQPEMIRQARQRLEIESPLELPDISRSNR